MMKTSQNITFSISISQIPSMKDAEQSQDESTPPRSRHAFAQSRVTPQTTTATAGRTRRISQRPYPYPSSWTSCHQDLKTVLEGFSLTDSSAIGNRDKLYSDFNLRPFLDSPRSQIGSTSTGPHTDASSPIHSYLSPDVTDTNHSGAAGDDAHVSRTPSPQETPSETEDNADLQRCTEPDVISHLNKHDKTKTRHITFEVSARNSARDQATFHYPVPRAALDGSDTQEHRRSACKEMRALHPRVAHIKRLRLRPLRSGATNEDGNGNTSAAPTPPPAIPEESSSSSLNVDQLELPRPCTHPLTLDSVEENTEPPESPRLHPFTTDFEDEFEEEEVEDDGFDYFDPEAMRTVPSSLLTTPPPPPGPTELTPTSIRKLAIMRHNKRFTSRGVRYPGYLPSMLGPDWGKFHACET